MSLKELENTYFILYHDLKYIIKLNLDTPQVYFKFHFTNRPAFLKLFEYSKIIKNHQ
jgi:hypothetical protein